MKGVKNDADRVDNTVLREAFLRSDMSAAAVATCCGWVKPGGRGDGTHVLRLLGVKSYSSGRYVCQRRTLSYDDAVLVTRALGLDPVEVGV